MTFPAGQLTEEFKTQTYMGFEGTRDQVMNALSKQGNESIIQTNVGDASISTSEQEKKKRERQALNHILLDAEQYRNNAIGGLQDDINKFQKQLDNKKKEVEGLKLKEQNLLLLQQKRDNGTLDQNDPDDAARMKQAGLNDSSQIDEALKTVQDRIAKVNEEVKTLDTEIAVREKAVLELRNLEGVENLSKDKVNEILAKYKLESVGENLTAKQAEKILNKQNKKADELVNRKLDRLDVDEEVGDIIRDHAAFQQNKLTKPELMDKIEKLSSDAKAQLFADSPEIKILIEEHIRSPEHNTHEVSSNKIEQNLSFNPSTL